MSDAAAQYRPELPQRQSSTTLSTSLQTLQTPLPDDFAFSNDNISPPIGVIRAGPVLRIDV
jgi:hypothetical protein